MLFLDGSLVGQNDVESSTCVPKTYPLRNSALECLKLVNHWVIQYSKTEGRRWGMSGDGSLNAFSYGTFFVTECSAISRAVVT